MLCQFNNIIMILNIFYRQLILNINVNEIIEKIDGNKDEFPQNFRGY